ncbi:MAG TPA: hypothetical protein VMS73_05160 [Anaerolineaceae bacterium]|nr:hypothetical protein [Anaerolineaceae bacterium]
MARQEKNPENKEKNEKPEPKPKKEKPVPIFLETAFTVSRVCVILIGLTAAILSLLAGNDVLSSAIRSVVAMLVTGFLFWLITWLVIRGSMDTVIASIKKASNEAHQNTKDLSA